MGGYGALQIAMKHPDLFGSVSAHSAVLLKDLSAAKVADRRIQMFQSLFDGTSHFYHGDDILDEIIDDGKVAHTYAERHAEWIR